MKAKIGQIITFKTDHKINVKSGGTALVRKGDRAQVLKKIDDTTGEILYLTGEAAGKSQYVRLEVDENIDEDAIAKKILEELSK
ncbi:hypothetical protein KQI89_15740 [Clostridium sp. MSJ-4]|uniref:Uncharacterized protein n=1 Tax=Clostridium simiarum TaxID=2841506 RepID=A0ABS6F4H6_9CLOT|nr:MULTISPECIES: hypothetical protein [Clostridium]MBU5593201.1 hypothetical protein [Clostridium simiarum]